MQLRSARTASAPSSVQRMPDWFMRMPTTFLQLAWATPEPICKPRGAELFVVQASAVPLDVVAALARRVTTGPSRLQIHYTPSSRITRHRARWKPRRSVSRRPRRTQSDGSGSVLRLAALSLAAE